MDDKQVKALFAALNKNGYGASIRAITMKIIEDKIGYSFPVDCGDFERCYWVVESVPFF